MGFRSILENVQKRGLRDLLNPRNISNFIKSLWIKTKGINIPEAEVLSYSEQLVYRSIKCSDCFRDKKCHDCSCPQPDAAIVREHKCSAGNYGEMLSPSDWEGFKKREKINFKINYYE